MPVQRCRFDSKPGYRWGSKGKCYTYNPENKASETKAKNKALDQGVAIGEFYKLLIEKMKKFCNDITGTK